MRTHHAPSALGIVLHLAACAGAPAAARRGAGPGERELAAERACADAENVGEASDARAGTARTEHCAEAHWLGRIGLPCETAMRFYSARSIATLSACTDQVFATTPDTTPREEAAQRAGHDCTRSLLRSAPPDPCGRRVLARAVCERARECGRDATVPGCTARGEAELHPAIAATVGLWNQTGKAAMAHCIGSLACGVDARRATQIDCLVAGSTGGL